MSQELFRLCTKTCSPVPARRPSEGFLSLHLVRQDQSLGHHSPCSHGMALLASSSSSWFTSCLSGEINPRSQGDKVGIIIKAAHEPCPYQTSASLWPVEIHRSCEEPCGSTNRTCAAAKHEWLSKRHLFPPSSPNGILPKSSHPTSPLYPSGFLLWFAFVSKMLVNYKYS